MRFPFVIDRPLYCYLLLDTFITQKTVLPCHIDMGVQFFNEYMHWSITVTTKEIMNFFWATSPKVDRR